MAHLLVVATADHAGHTDDEQHQQGEGSAVVHGVAQHDVLLDDGAEEAYVVHRQQLRDGEGRYRGQEHHHDTAHHTGYRQGEYHLEEHAQLVGPEVLCRLDEALIDLHHRIIYGVDHEGQEVVGEAKEQGALAEGYARDVEERHGSQGADEHVDPHGQDEEQHHRLGAVKLLVAQDICRRVAQQDGKKRRYYGHGHRVDEGVEGLGLLYELHEVGDGEAAVIVHEGIHADEHQRQQHKQHEEHRIGYGPGAATGKEFYEFVHFCFTLRKLHSLLSF